MKNLCLQLLKAQNEGGVSKIIEQNPSLFSQKNWHPIDNNDNNFGLIEALGRSPERALVEKITNAIDAVLVKECRARKIKPESSSAPRTIKQALEMFFDIENGDLSSISEDKKDKLASLIYVIVENMGDKRANFYIIDKGEGQRPEDFRDTFLKFGGNKAKIYFVHGRFGTGSFGVLPNSGDNKYQLILSKKFFDTNGADGLWGWTLIRRNRADGLETKHAWYEYLTNNESIYSFSENDLSCQIRDCIKYERLDLPELTYGTVIKLYSYDLPNSSDVDRDLYRIFNRYLFTPALPFRILDAQTKSHVGPGKEVDGNLNRLRKNKSEIEANGDLPTLKIQRVLLPRLGYVDVDIYIAKRRPGKKSFIESEKISTNDEAIFFIRNGQSHGELSRSFVRDDLGLEYIAKDVVIFIDCSDTPPVEFDDIFPPTRDDLRENRHRIAVEEILRNELKNHEGLKEFNLRRRSNVIAESVEKTKDFETFVNDLYTLDPALRKVLTGSLKISDLSMKGSVVNSEYKGSYFPTRLEVKDNEIKNKGLKTIPTNSYVRILLDTDAQNDYLYREKDKGELLFDFKGKIGSYKLYNGCLTIKVLPPVTAGLNSEDILKISLTRPYDESLTQELKVRYTAPIIPRVNPPPPPRPPQTKQIALPEFHSYSREQWLNLGYEEGDACELGVERDNSNTHYILKEVNIHKDFAPFMEYLRSQNVSQRKIEEMKKMFELSLYISALVVHKDFSTDHSYKRDAVRMVMTQLAKSLPFTIFTMQKRWLKEVVSPEE